MIAMIALGASALYAQQRYDFSDIFRLFGKSESKVVKVDLGMEAPKLQAGRLYYIAPSFLR